MKLPILNDEIQKRANKIECNRCGLCCHLPSGKPCKYLGDAATHTEREDNKHKFYCRIYNKAGRIGTPIGEGCVCNNILHVPQLYEGCTYNDIKIEIYGEEIKDIPKRDVP